MQFPALHLTINVNSDQLPHIIENINKHILTIFYLYFGQKNLTQNSNIREKRFHLAGKVLQ